MKKTLLIIICILILVSGACIEKKEKNVCTRYYPIIAIDKFPQNLLCSKELSISLFEGLVKYNDKKEIVPALAGSYIISNNGLEYSFKIRENAYWSDGRKITAKDFVDYFLNYAKQNRNSEEVEKLFCISGFKDYSLGSKKAEEVGIQAIDDNNLLIKLNSINANFLGTLCNSEFLLKDTKDDFNKWKQSFRSIKYSGAFVIDSVSKNNEIALYSNSKYYNLNEIKEDKIVIKQFGSAEKCLASFETHNSDLVLNPPINEVERLKQQNFCSIYPTDKLYVMNLNLKKNNFISDPNFCKALESSLCRQEIIEKVNESILKTVSPNEFNSPEDKTIGEKYLQSSKYNKEKITLSYIDNTENRKMSQAIKESISNNLGVQITCLPLEVNDFYSRIRKDDYEIYLNQVNSSSFSKNSNIIPLVYLNIAVCSRKEITNLTFDNEGNLILSKIILKEKSSFV